MMKQLLSQLKLNVVRNMSKKAISFLPHFFASQTFQRFAAASNEQLKNVESPRNPISKSIESLINKNGVLSLQSEDRWFKTSPN